MIGCACLSPSPRGSRHTGLYWVATTSLADIVVAEPAIYTYEQVVNWSETDDGPLTLLNGQCLVLCRQPAVKGYPLCLTEVKRYIESAPHVGRAAARVRG